MTIPEALTKATAGGYQSAFTPREPALRVGIVGLHTFSTMHVDAIWLDLECWRALGRTLGWQHERVWQGYWQGFSAHLAHGNTPEACFATV